MDDEERLIVPKREAEEPESFPVWMWILAVVGLVLAMGGAVILVRMGVHRS